MNPMRLRSPLYLLLLSTAVLSACADRTPTGLQTAPSGAPSLSRSGSNDSDSDSDSDKKKNNGDSDSDSDDSNSGSGSGTPRLVMGNISGDGNAVCRAVGYTGATGYKVDGNNGATIGGFKFVVSNDKYLSFTQTSAGNVVLGVVVKGGPNTHVYDFGSGATSGSGMNAPKNGGGNTPEISHYTVCYKPKPSVPYTWTIEKKLVKATTLDPVTHAMPVVPTNPLVIPVGETRWIEFEISVTRSATGSTQGTAAVVDLAQGICGSLGAGFVCTSAELGSPLTNKTFNVTGTTKIKVIIDVKNTGAPCGVTKTLTNTVKLTPTGGTALPTSSASVTIATPACAPPPPRWELDKKILGYYVASPMIPANYRTGSTITFNDGCLLDAAYSTYDKCVIWVEYEIVARRIGGATTDHATITDDIIDRCVELFFGSGARVECQYPGGTMDPFATRSTAVMPSETVGNVTTFRHKYFVDIWNRNDCKKTRTLNNTAKLTAPGVALTDSELLTMVFGACAPGVNP